MNKANTAKLHDRFPFLGSVHFEHGDGWFQLIWDLCEGIEKVSPEGIILQQVKEKFGGLRFYIGAGTIEVFALIDAAEAKSFEVCEKCGEPGKVRGGSWIRTLCDGCAE